MPPPIAPKTEDSSEEGEFGADFLDRERGNATTSGETTNTTNTTTTTTTTSAADLERLREEIAIAKEMRELLRQKQDLERSIRDMTDTYAMVGGNVPTLSTQNVSNVTIAAQSAIAICNLATRCPKFDGNPAKVVEFVTAIDRYITEFKLTNTEAAQMVGMCLVEGSAAREWLNQRIARQDKQNIHEWKEVPEKNVRGGLRTALLEYFGVRSEFAIIEQKLRVCTLQKEGQRVSEWSIKLSDAILARVKAEIPVRFHQIDGLLNETHENSYFIHLRMGMLPKIKELLRPQLEAKIITNSMQLVQEANNIEISHNLTSGKPKTIALPTSGSINNPIKIEGAMSEMSLKMTEQERADKTPSFCNYCQKEHPRGERFCHKKIEDLYIKYGTVFGQPDSSTKSNNGEKKGGRGGKKGGRGGKPKKKDNSASIKAATAEEEPKEAEEGAEEANISAVKQAAASASFNQPPAPNGPPGYTSAVWQQQPPYGYYLDSYIRGSNQ